MIRLLFYLFIGYIIYKIIKFIIKNLKEKDSQKIIYYYDEYGNLREEKDITKEAKIIKDDK